MIARIFPQLLLFIAFVTLQNRGEAQNKPALFSLRSATETGR